jgi:hypothetical protein
MTTPVRCHPSVSRPTAPLSRCIRRIAARFPVGPPGALEDRIERLNRERPRLRRIVAPRGRSRFNAVRRLREPTPSTQDALTGLGGVKGARAALGGSAALDPASARCGVGLYRWRRSFLCSVNTCQADSLLKGIRD